MRTALPSRRASCWDMTEHLRRLYLIKTPATGISGETSEVLVNKLSRYPMFYTLKPFGCCCLFFWLTFCLVRVILEQISGEYLWAKHVRSYDWLTYKLPFNQQI